MYFLKFLILNSIISTSKFIKFPMGFFYAISFLHMIDLAFLDHMEKGIRFLKDDLRYLTYSLNHIL